MDKTAVAYNSQLLADEDYDFEAFIASHSNTTLDYGSEFKPIEQLESILGQHPNFLELCKILSHGMDYRFTWHLPEEL
jgi:hypothetical protein